MGVEFVSNGADEVRFIVCGPLFMWEDVFGESVRIVVIGDFIVLRAFCFRGDEWEAGVFS
jgi:hypothetical protein